MIVIYGPFYLLVSALLTLNLYDAYKLGVLPYSVTILVLIALSYVFWKVKAMKNQRSHRKQLLIGLARKYK